MRLWSRLLLVVLVAAIVALYPLLAPTPHRIDQEHFRLIKGGMTIADVQAIFGASAGEYDWAEADPGGFETRFLMSVRRQGKIIQGAELADLELIYAITHTRRSKTWVSRHGAFIVGFDREGRVITTSGGSSRVVPPWKRWWKAIWE